MDKEKAEKNAYEVVDVGSDATEAEIKKAYRQRSLKTHPDRVRRSPTSHSQSAHHLRVSFVLRTPILKMQVSDRRFSSNRASKF
jgi:DnaJ family protein C protein 17